MAVIERGVFLDKTVTRWEKAVLKSAGGYWHVIVDNLVMGRVHRLNNGKFQLWLDGKRIDYFQSEKHALKHVTQIKA
ncbi:hypothetical protein R367_004558 [Salmonella enterica subsp. enterica serovar Braenderup]|nr:hypothetical protein [Salmonella enterica subsp. enterica serovar Braenderup]